MLADPAGLGSWLDAAGDPLFEPGFWSARGAAEAAGLGRGSAWFIDAGKERWVLRHYRRGGTVTRMLGDWFAWIDEGRVRSFQEFRLLEDLFGQGLPVPKPIAARYQRSGLIYRCDLIMQRIADTTPLSALLARAAIGVEQWRAVGAAIARLHRAGVDHADLTAHNILIGTGGAVSIVDFDRGRVRPTASGGAAARPAWAERNLKRLHRSFVKVSRGWPAGRFSATAWQDLMTGYASSGG